LQLRVKTSSVKGAILMAECYLHQIKAVLNNQIPSNVSPKIMKEEKMNGEASLQLTF
jgi:hypothetical protein